MVRISNISVWIMIVLGCGFCSSFLNADTLHWTANVECKAIMAFPGQILTDEPNSIQHDQSASAYAHVYDTTSLYGSLRVSGTATGILTDPDSKLLESTLTTSIAWKDFFYLADFVQDGYTSIDAVYVPTHDPNGTVCSVEYEVTFPINSLSGGDSAWKLNIDGPFSSIEAGYNYVDGDFGYKSGILTAITGQNVAVKLQHAAGGVFDSNGDFLSSGTQRIRVSLRQIDHPADINTDGAVNIADFSVLAQNWLQPACPPDDSPCNRADINQSSAVDMQDLYWLAYYWLIGQ